LLALTEINISDHKLGKHYFSAAPNLRQAELKHSVVDKAID